MVDADHVRASRPQKVTTAVTLLYVSLGIGAFRLIFEAPRMSEIAPPEVVIPGSIAGLAIMALFIYLIGTGRNWVRITFLVLVIAGIPFSVQPLLQSLAANPVSGALGIGQAVLQIIALVLLYQKPSSDWFRQLRKKPTPPPLPPPPPPPPPGSRPLPPPPPPPLGT